MFDKIADDISNAYQDGFNDGAQSAATWEWNIIKSRPMSEKEREEYSERLGYDIDYEEAVIYFPLPEDGQEVLLCNMYNRMWVDKFENDPDYGCSFEENGDMDGIAAWMPLPPPPKMQ